MIFIFENCKSFFEFELLTLKLNNLVETYQEPRWDFIVPPSRPSQDVTGTQSGHHLGTQLGHHQNPVETPPKQSQVFSRLSQAIAWTLPGPN
jgi:hypothetical protein